MAWADVPSSATAAHRMAECSDQGLCNRVTGLCICFQNFDGMACERLKCHGDQGSCNGHGVCLKMSALASKMEAFPLSSVALTYTGAMASTTWDEDMVASCLCDSSWKVGFDSGEKQASEWFGPGCQFRTCEVDARALCAHAVVYV